MSDSSTPFRLPAFSGAVAAAVRDRGPMTLVVSGGRPGVGATTLAVQLAATLGQDALRVVLIDADLYRADVAAQCRLPAGQGIGDVLAGRKNIHEVLVRGPAGIQVLAGTAANEIRDSLSERAIQRLLRQMKTLAPHADWLLVDAGNQPSEFAARLWSAADRLLLVTLPDAVAVMDTYALIKTLLSRQRLAGLPELLVNQAPDEAIAIDVHRRIDQSCQRFLGVAIEFSGAVPLCPASQDQVNEPLARAVCRLAKNLIEKERRVAAA